MVYSVGSANMSHEIQKSVHIHSGGYFHKFRRNQTSKVIVFFFFEFHTSSLHDFMVVSRENLDIALGVAAKPI